MLPQSPEKECSACRQRLPLGSFAVNKRRRDGLDSWCRPCHSAYDQRRYVEKTREITRVRATLRYRANKEESRARVKARAAVKLQTPAATRATPIDKAYFLRLHTECMACTTTTDLVIDHVVPLAKGGADTLSNYQVLCAACNRRKKDKTIDYRPIWAAQQQRFGRENQR